MGCSSWSGCGVGGNTGATSFNDGRRVGDRVGNSATRATLSQLPLAVPSSGSCSSPILTVMFNTKYQKKKCWKTCQELCLCGRALWGDSSRMSCGYFGDQGRERRNSHSRLVSPWPPPPAPLELLLGAENGFGSICSKFPFLCVVFDSSKHSPVGPSVIPSCTGF